ncbi:hypothetical protein [Marinobacter caseinilyticus]|uniref:hypothetical protein n=1 Tax=Marinobacter caseinilyticus TaxID=2692195 RepID=UPI00140CD072|nr:hypothetical protein [Marinobacter caseinilyticus]
MIKASATKSVALSVTVIVLLSTCGTAAAEEDLGVTMRMVADDEALNETFVQQLELPSSLDESPESVSVDELNAGDIIDDARSLEESVAEQARESRDALNVELPGELSDELEISQPGLDVPSLESPDLALPGTGEIDLQILESESLKPKATELQ